MDFPVEDKVKADTDSLLCGMDDDVRIEIIEGAATPEQRAAYKRFMDFYKAKIINDFSRKKYS